MQELRLVLIIVGALAIAGLLLHGLWSSRKEKPAKFGEKPLGKLNKASRDSEGFDKDGVGSVRVVGSEIATEEAPRQERKEPELHFGAKLDADPLLDGQGVATPSPAQSEAPPVPEVKHIPMEEPAVENVVAPTPTDITAPAEPQPHVQAEPQAVKQEPIAPQPPIQQPANKAAEKVEPVLNVESAEHVAFHETASIESIENAQQAAQRIASLNEAEQAVSVPEPTNVVETVTPVETANKAERVEPVAFEPAVEPTLDVEEPVEAPEQPAEAEVLPPDYLVLNIHARNGELFRGSRLFNAFEQNHLIFGENSVYHRHVDAAGTGPAIFSVTNMVHPAHFPEGGSDSFETPGVAFYLMLPCAVGRADQSFNVMLQTVQRIADSLGGDVLDHERNLITPHRISGYRDKAQRYTVN
ncbi:cell division protein ZipA [Photobacterium satsumensis]|uniref:cell division protein ZipA n=1 Tax=Photobacterium satsumensis TaxID=2910239 RepID=UPI003D1410EF